MFERRMITESLKVKTEWTRLSAWPVKEISPDETMFIRGLEIKIEDGYGYVRRKNDEAVMNIDYVVEG